MIDRATGEPQELRPGATVRLLRTITYGRGNRWIDRATISKGTTGIVLARSPGGPNYWLVQFDPHRTGTCLPEELEVIE